VLSIDDGLAQRLYQKANADRWRVAAADFASALAASATKALGESARDAREIERYLTSLHLSDLALACACAAGDEQAWEAFIREHRPALYRAADALDPSGGARELADSLYADLFGIASASGERKSLFRYFHGRSSLVTWLRAVLAQRMVDRARVRKREDALPDDESSAAIAAPPTSPNPDRAQHLELMQRALGEAVAALDAQDRLRLRCYYAQGMTLAETGRLVGEHEATVSRQLARARRTIRADVERRLGQAGLSADEIERCVEEATEDPGSLDVAVLVEDRKKSVAVRSQEEKAR
jgi:RNA polymerase sigma-70 factor (ECF subfamily)